MLHYKPEFGDWDVAQIPYGADEFTLDDLLCGQRYHLYVTAYNDIGKVIFRSFPIISNQIELLTNNEMHIDIKSTADLTVSSQHLFSPRHR